MYFIIKAFKNLPIGKTVVVASLSDGDLSRSDAVIFIKEPT